ncbi:uncharacterized protein LOC106459580 isoform X2 [Limulus polyphemus]|uniref:Uncharacterized protein LOC106459580 isoform X2 n=1 Tax=Limulus polyphemus TaxID=6850 RepID=A0ABM1SDU2_LIMPO|nr:uncharacterized protein LOC106459580 isoform X2 [Limulus polyphemus]
MMVTPSTVRELVVNPNCSTHPTKEEDSKHINQDNSLTAQVVSRAQTLVSRASVALQNVTARTQSQQIPLYQTPTGRSRSSFFSRRDEITNPTKGNTSSHSPSSHLEAAQRAVRSHPLWKKGAELLAKAESLGDLTSSRCAQPSLSSKIPTFLSPRKPSSNFFQKNNDIKSKLQEKTRHLSQPNNRVSKSGQSKVEVTRKEESHKRNTAAKKKTSTAVLSAKPVCASSHKRSELSLTTQPVLECENQITKSSFVTLERDSTKGIRKSESCPHYPTKKENFLKETSENHDNKSCTNTVSKKKILRSQQRHNIKSDSELYGDSHLKSVLNILRSNLGPEEKLLAIKQKHDYWEQFSQISLLQKQEKSVQNEETNNCVIEADKSISSHVKQEQILSNSVNDNIYIKKTAPSSEDFSFVDLNVKKHQRCLNVMKTSSYSNIENGSQTNMTKEFNVPAKLDGMENVALSKRRQDTGIQGGEIHCKSANMTKKELKSILKIDVDRLSVEKTTPSQKSPVTVQEWVNSIQLAPGEESRSVEEKQNVCEQLPRSQTEKITPDVPISPTEQLREGSFDDNLYLGAEARNLDGVLQEAAVNRVANSLSPQSRRMSFGDLQSKQSSFNSDFSSYSGISSLSSVESLLEARRGDPEEVLLALGFGGKLPKDPISRIPKRFLLQPSCAKGVKVEDFLKHQEYLLARRVSGPLEFLGVSSQFHLKQQYLRRKCSSSCSFPQVARLYRW